ncbi:pseudouridine synthase [Alicyclobacillus acidoterrestris]|uniref:pseudouridine synthase n=1 Tax=Alicyclobacillus suci TaxID=2816080 RepID=UPI001196947F|nr:pseudouridine synthase [Alicyclobacillus suci]GEO25728.1 pseudouridine synthase [Alicyclobacillus acidoterrestris]
MERLQKVLAHAGVASRRKCEQLIAEGRVTVDGQTITEMGYLVDAEKQTIAVDGKPVAAERKVILLLNKPTAYMTTVSDPEGRRTVMSLLPQVAERLYPVGRLDYDTSGLLLFTNDGALTERLLHPSRDIEKVYRVTVEGKVDKEARQRLAEGIELEDGLTAPAQVEMLRQGDESVVQIAIHEGRNRQVRRMFEALGLPVKRLKRIAFGPIALGHLKTGQWRLLEPAEWKALYRSVELTPPPYARPTFPKVERKERPARRGKRPSRHGTRNRKKS